ncbi:MAG: 50S ribosomal protein L30 [Terriglobia bacterium]
MKAKTKTVRVKWVRSAIGFSYRQKQMVRSLGLRRLNNIVELEDTASVRGLIARLSHLVQVVDREVAPAWASSPEYVVRPPADVKDETPPAQKNPSARRRPKTSSPETKSEKA